MLFQFKLFVFKGEGLVNLEQSIDVATMVAEALEKL